MGNARTFLVNWAMARQHGWEIVLRIEDLDGPRIKNDADRLAIEILQWLGMDWDYGPYYQLHDLSHYHSALRTLGKAGVLYPCRCSRSQIASAQSAPHGDEHELRYPGTCKPGQSQSSDFDPALTDVAWRMRAPDEALTFDDLLHGLQSCNVQQTVGDFVVATKAGLPAYQLAVVVDDAAQGVTHIVRGDDLIRSTPRQMLLYQALGLGAAPAYCHLPLVLGADGRRLAKRHGDTRLDTYRQRGVSAERIIGLMAEWCGMGERSPMTAGQFAAGFDLNKLSHEPVTFNEADEQWLIQGAI